MPDVQPISPVDTVVARINAARSAWGRETSLKQMRDDWDGLFATAPRRSAIRPDEVGGVPVAWITGGGAGGEKTFVCLHGGGFQLGSISSHVDLVARISAASGLTGLIIDYRLAPEHPFPAAIEDVLAVCAGLEERQIGLGALSFVGDSAGGNLALASIIALRDRGSTLPGSVVLLSPWADLQALGASYETRAATDPINQRKVLLSLARAYLGNADASLRLASPINANLTGFPPMLIQVGDREVMLSDAEILAARARAAGVDVDLNVWPNMVHMFQQFPSDLREAREAIKEIGVFLSAISQRP
jgi:acetyl esterase/lipase